MDRKPTNAEKSQPKQSTALFKPGLANEVKLVWGLMRHPDVPFMLKLIPVGALIYLIWPWDVMIGPFDDAAVLWLGTYFFIESCPPHAVKQVKDMIANPAIKIRPRSASGPISDEDVIEGEFRDLDDESQPGSKTPPDKPADRKTRPNKPKDPNSL